MQTQTTRATLPAPCFAMSLLPLYPFRQLLAVYNRSGFSTSRSSPPELGIPKCFLIRHGN
eukprot:1270320-Rhodomonas_salina.2